MKAHPKLKSIKDHQGYIEALYGRGNRNRSSDYLYGYLSRSAAYLGKNLSQKKAENQHFIRTLSWLYAIANFYSLDLQLCLFSRFPAVCPYCLSSPCICFRTNKLPVDYIPAYKAKEELEARYRVYEGCTSDWSLTAASSTLAHIYPSNEIIWHHAGPWHLLAKMQEEIGELHEAISKFSSKKKSKSAIGEELADTLAWLLSAWRIVFPDRSLDDALIDYYIRNCPVCLSLPCRCADRSDRSAELIDPKALDKILASLKKLERLLSKPESTQLQELRKSVEAAKLDQSEPTTVHALKETKSTLEKLKDGLSTADEVGKKGLSIIDSVMKIVNMIPWA